MADTLAPYTHCQVCNKPHIRTREHGYYATNGHPLHPYKPPAERGLGLVEMDRTRARQDEVMAPPRSIRDRADTTGFHPALFGALHACDHCGAIVDHPDLELHRGTCHPREAA